LSDPNSLGGSGQARKHWRNDAALQVPGIVGNGMQKNRGQIERKSGALTASAAG
jgi:hypothetical protein